MRHPAFAASTSHCRMGTLCIHVPLKGNTTLRLRSPTYQQLLPTNSPRTSLVLMLRHPATRPRSCTSNQVCLPSSRLRAPVSRGVSAVSSRTLVNNAGLGLDFVRDTLAEGKLFRVLRVLDQWSRQSPLREVGAQMWA